MSKIKPLIYTVAAALLSAGASYAASHSSTSIENSMTLQNLVGHLKSFQQFADNNTELPGTRMTNTQGFFASRDYIIRTLQDAGYFVYTQDVPLEISFIAPGHTIAETHPTKKEYRDNIDYSPVVNSGGGDVSAAVQVPSGSAFGCAASDFAGFQAGSIALLQFGSGECSRSAGIKNAIAAGAKAVLIYNPAIKGVYHMTVGFPIPSVTTPISLISIETANELKQAITAGAAPKLDMHFKMIKKNMVSQNIIAESRTGNPDQIVMTGAHYDSLHGNSGMNDNASSVAAVLETALLMKEMRPINQLRFAFWTGEELGLVGSTYYVEHLSKEEVAKIKVYLNYEVLGAPNGGRFIMGYAEGITPKGSEKVTQKAAEYFKSQGLKYFIFDPRMGDAARRSDMMAFMKAGIPVGFMVSGAETPWLKEMSLIFTDLPNRVIGMTTHPCYHKYCDILTLPDGQMKDANFDFDLYLQMSKAAAYMTYNYSISN